MGDWTILKEILSPNKEERHQILEDNVCIMWSRLKRGEAKIKQKISNFGTTIYQWYPKACTPRTETINFTTEIDMYEYE